MERKPIWQLNKDDEYLSAIVYDTENGYDVQLQHNIDGTIKRSLTISFPTLLQYLEWLSKQEWVNKIYEVDYNDN